MLLKDELMKESWWVLMRRVQMPQSCEELWAAKQPEQNVGPSFECPHKISQQKKRPCNGVILWGIP